MIEIGNTPLVELKEIEEMFKLNAKIYAKLECFNPAGSIKDRIAKKMIEEAEKEGKINNDTVIIEPTSGNTGIGIAYFASLKGYKVKIVMPESMSIERRNKIASFGAELVLTPAALGMSGSIQKAEELVKENPNSIILGQFVNPNNPKAHYESTGPEIYSQREGKVDIFVSGVGTGGTITGVGRYLKEKNPNVKLVAVEPTGSPVLSKGVKGSHKIQGIGAGFVPQTLDTSLIDEIVTVSDDDAFEYGRIINKIGDFFVGISSGAALKAAIEVAQKEENKGKDIVVIFPDSGDRYLSTPLFE